MTQDGRVYTSAEVAAAAGISRGTFDAWLLRKHLPLPPGPGKGGARLFTLFDAVMVAVTAELVSLEITIAAAARIVGSLYNVHNHGKLIPLDDPGWMIVLTTTKWKRADPDKARSVEYAFDNFASARELAEAMERDPEIAARVVVDFSKVAARVREAIDASPQ